MCRVWEEFGTPTTITHDECNKWVIEAIHFFLVDIRFQVGFLWYNGESDG